MRRLNKEFEKELKKGGLFYPIVATVINDPSLDLEIRDNYINIYFRGNSILKLTDQGKFKINEKFLEGININKSIFENKDDVENFTNKIPLIKKNVTNVKSKRPNLEIEYEQFLIRSNNLNENVNSEIFITDRQYVDNTQKSRFDLSGFFWGKKNRRRNQTVPMVFIEIKYSLNPDISNIDKQINQYYEVIEKNIVDLAKETEYLKNLKIDLGLIKQPNDRLNALKTLKISNKIEDTKFIIVLIDYNPNSSKFKKSNLQKLSFNKQIRIFNCGFAIWEEYLAKI